MMFWKFNDCQFSINYFYFNLLPFNSEIDSQKPIYVLFNDRIIGKKMLLNIIYNSMIVIAKRLNRFAVQ